MQQPKLHGSLLDRFAPARLQSFVRNRCWMMVCLQVAALLGAFITVDRFMTRSLRMPQSSYESESLIVAFLGNLHWLVILALLVVVTFAAVSGLPKVKWEQLEGWKHIKWFVLILSAAMTWFVVTLNHNFYFEQGYVAEKLLVFGLLILLAWRPVFIFPFLIVLYLVFWQLGQPALNNGSHFAHKLQVLHVLNLFAAWFLLHAFQWRPSWCSFFLWLHA